MRRVLPVLGVALLLAACKPASVVHDAAAPAAADVASGANDKASTTPAPPQLAMAYHYGLALPSAQVRPLMESHQDACERAGPLQCQVLGAAAKAEGRDRAEAQLTLRATPAWVRLFRARAEADVKDAGGKVVDSGTTGEDLSGPIVDADAAHKARQAELARLQGLMARRTKNLQDTLDIEHEITRVQGEMNQASSEMTLMTYRVAMETVTVDYQSLAALAPDGVGAPVAQAGQAFVGHLMGGFALLLTLASYSIPFILVGAPLVWLFSRRARKPATPVV